MATMEPPAENGEPTPAEEGEVLYDSEKDGEQANTEGETPTPASDDDEAESEEA